MILWAILGFILSVTRATAVIFSGNSVLFKYFPLGINRGLMVLRSLIWNYELQLLILGELVRCI